MTNLTVIKSYIGNNISKRYHHFDRFVILFAINFIDYSSFQSVLVAILWGTKCVFKHHDLQMFEQIGIIFTHRHNFKWVEI